MKLRCTENSLRLRVRKSDLEVLKTAGRVAQAVTFAPYQVLTFVLQSSSTTAIQAQFENGTITVLLPSQETAAWIDNQQVGLEQFQLLPDGQKLHILIEKDFPCQHVSETNFDDTFHELVPPAE
jgi:hypothetical protein